MQTFYCSVMSPVVYHEHQAILTEDLPCLLPYRCLPQLLPRRIVLADLAHFGWSHFGIAGQFRPLKALQLSLSCSLYPRANDF